MGRNPISLPFDAVLLRQILRNKDLTKTELADKIGVTKQAVSTWFSEELIPPRRLSDISEALQLSKEEVESLFDERESRKHLARENRILRDENQKLKEALAVFTSGDSA